MAFKISNDKSVNELQNEFKSFSDSLNSPSSQSQLANELESIALISSNLEVKVNFNASYNDFSSAIVSLNNTSGLCEFVSCFKYFDKSCQRDNYTCIHKCFGSDNLYCKNDGLCLYEKDYKPICA